MTELKRYILGDYMEVYQASEVDAILPRWIPVSERLPENDNDVLLLSLDGLIEIGWLAEDQWRTTEDLTVMYYNTHWMPLPPAPTETEI